MDDVISRQAAIDALGEEPEAWPGNDEYAQGLKNQWWHDVYALKTAPPTQPERKKGKWIGYNTDKYGWKRADGSPVFVSCSECFTTVLNNGSPHWNYCPNCGAKMEEVNDDEQ